MTIKILPYNLGSASAKLLSNALGCLRLKTRGSSYVPKRGDIVINWGYHGPLPASYFNTQGFTLLNSPSRVINAVNKIRCFERLKELGVKHPLFWTNKEEARQWLHEGEGTRKLVCRTIVNGQEGRGIIICTNPLDIPDCPLYTQYIKKKAEYRIHAVAKYVHDGDYSTYAISASRKGLRQGMEPNDVRNTANGYVFVRTSLDDVPDKVLKEAGKAILALGLDFGGVDVVWNEHYQEAYVLEVNTAPGIEGSAVDAYVNHFNSLKD
jgi:glutathione synthase/RimK-type ligase-like ATP-grasp enzyme